MCQHKSFWRGTKSSQIFGLTYKIWTGTKHFATCKRTRHIMNLKASKYFANHASQKITHRIHDVVQLYIFPQHFLVKSRHIHFSFVVFYPSMDDLPLNIIRKKHILQIMRYKKSHTQKNTYMTWHSFTFSLCIFLPI